MSISLYSCQSSDPKINAQRNLMGRTHYVDDDTLRFHKSRIISARHTDGGLLFAIVTSDQLNYEGTKRGFRFVVFDVYGTVLERTELEQAYRTSAQATKAMWQWLNGADAVTATRKAIEKQRKRYADELADLEDRVSKIAAEIGHAKAEG